MTEALPSPGQSKSAFSRAIAVWRSETQGSPETEIDVGDRPFDVGEPERSILAYAPYAVALVLILGVGAAAASLATAPALTDSIETVAAMDARAMGLDAKIDPTGLQKKSATLIRDVGSMKSEIARLQRALEQAKSNQVSLTRQAAGQVTVGQDEVRALKGEIAALQRSLDATHEQSAKRIEALAALVEQPNEDARRVADLQQRLDRVERETAEKAGFTVREPEPQTTGSVARDRETARSAPRGGPVVRHWTVREVVRGVALLEGRRGVIEVVRGARAPGMGRVRSIERRDGQWVVVTDRGLVIERNEL